MKKCASCTKDLPDAALHCVFCGAKQPPAPAVQQGLAKTAFGYSANDVLEQVKQGRHQPIGPASSPYNPQYRSGPGSGPGPGPGQMPPPPGVPLGLAQTMAQAPRTPPPAVPSSMPPPMAPPPMAPGPQGPYVPQSAANAKTMFVQAAPPGPPAPSYPQMTPPPSAMGPTLIPPPQQPPQMTMPAPPMRQPFMQIPAAQPPPYVSSTTASRVIRPIDPWQDSLRAMMFLWGLALLAAFATPLATSPAVVFHWTTILNGAGTARLPPLMIGAIGFLSVIIAVIPMPTAPRGLIAAILALGGIAVPIALVGAPPWQQLAPMIGLLLLVPGLLIRDEYRGALLPRLLVTLGVIGVLVPQLLPQSDVIPLVSMVKSLIDLPGSQKIAPALALGLLTVAVISLLAWLPTPATGAAKLWAWLLILWALFIHLTQVLLAGHFGDAITAAPNTTLVSWVVAGGGTIGSAYLVLVGYGLAALFGRQLE